MPKVQPVVTKRLKNTIRKKQAYDVLSILIIRENGYDTEYCEVLGKLQREKRKKQKQEEDADSCWVSACGCRGPCIQPVHTVIS